jgi:DNA-binding transcriptional LysR family regulator
METQLTDLGDLRAFCLVVDLGSITAAAKALGEGKGSVSRRLSRLEATLEVKLLRRTPRLVEATDEGALFRTELGPVLDQLADATATLRKAQSLPSGNLRVTAPYDLGVTVFAPLIAEFAERFPGVTVEMVLTEAVLNFESHKIDVAIRAAAQLSDSPSLVAQRLSTFPIAMYAAPSYLAKHGVPAKPEELGRHRFAVIPAWAAKASLSLWIEGDTAKRIVSVPIRPSIVASDHAFCREAALSGHTIAPLPSLLAQADVAAGRLVRVLEPYVLGEAGVYVVYQGSRRLQPKIRAFRDFLLEGCLASRTAGRRRGPQAGPGV